jgi:hypothetical protein
MCDAAGARGDIVPLFIGDTQHSKLPMVRLPFYLRYSLAWMHTKSNINEFAVALVTTGWWVSVSTQLNC